MRRLLKYIRSAHSLRLRVPDHFRLCVAQVVDINRNQRAGFGDEDHLAEAIAWLQRAQDVTSDGGVSGRYHLGRGWTSSYPETTGYIIPTLLKLADVKGDRTFIDRAERCTRFLLSTQLESGAFPGGEIAENRTAPSPFNSAQIIHGLLAWYRHANDQHVIDAAMRAADWLVSVQDLDGAFRQHFYGGVPASYSSHASCWLAELGVFTGDPQYLNAANRHLDWVLSQFDESTSWFDLCGFNPDEHKDRSAVSHTIAYTIFGVLYMSQLLGREEGIRAARRAALGALRRAEIQGGVPGRMEAGWRVAARFSCLTGNAQMAIIWFRLFELDHDIRFVNAALKALDEVKRAQPMRLKHPGLRGGIPGSAPVWGSYITFAFPNWAVKFFIDALLTKREVLRGLDSTKLLGAPAEPDRDVTSLQASSFGLPANPRVILYTSSASAKPHKLLKETSQWGFSPAAVIVETGAQAPAFTTRLRQKLRDDGPAALVRSILSRGGPAGGSPNFEKPPLTAQQLCDRQRIPIWSVSSVNSPEALRIIAGLEPDIAVHAGAGILRKAVLDIPKYATLNAHMGLLPFYRGMNVTEWAALKGDRVGCTVHFVDTGIDTGPIVATRSVSIETARGIDELRDLADQAQIRLLAEVLKWCFTQLAMPSVRTQTIEEGHQFFRMHDDLRRILAHSLESFKFCGNEAVRG